MEEALKDLPVKLAHVAMILVIALVVRFLLRKAIAAAVRNNARLLTAPLLLIGIGLAGRLLTIALSGYDASMLQPMAAEVVLIAIFATGRKLLPAA